MSYPTPILNLNFANAKQLVHPAVAFSRGSTGSYFDGSGILRYANNGVPRFDHDPLTGICKGLLSEPAATFLDTYSEQFDNAEWTKIRCSITANAAIAPDGTMTADKLVEDTANNSHYVIKNTTVTAGGTYTFSCYLKKSERNVVALEAYNGSAYPAAYFNLTSGTKGSVDAALTSYMEDVGSGWYKCSITFTMVSGTSCSCFVLLSTADLTQSYTGDGTSGLYIWGAKLYAGTGPTSYLPTVASGVTRAADVCTVDLTKLTRNGSPLWTGTEGTIVVDFVFGSKLAASWPVSISDGTSNNYIACLSSSGSVLLSNCVSSGVAQASISHGAASAFSRCKMAFAFASNSFGSSLSGGSVITDTSGSIPVVNTLTVGGLNAVNPLSGHIRSVQLYNRRIADTYLPALSAL